MRKSRLQRDTQTELVSLFIRGANIREAARLAEVNKNTANTYFNRLRQLICQKSDTPGFIEADYQPEDPALKHVMDNARDNHQMRPFGLVFEEDKTYIALLPDDDLLDNAVIIREKRTPDYLFFCNAKQGKNCISVAADRANKVVRINQCEYHSCPMKKNIGQNTFCSYFTHRQKQYHGIPKKQFYLYLKEFEWRFNHPDRNWQLNRLSQWAVDELG